MPAEVAVREELFARLSPELTPERIGMLALGELAKVVDAAVQAYFARHGAKLDPIARRDLITALIQDLRDANRRVVSRDHLSLRRDSTPASASDRQPRAALKRPPARPRKTAV